MKYVYPACFYPEDDGAVSVEFVDFELATFGDNLADAMYMAQDAVAGRILSLLADGETLPNPADIKKVKPEEGGFVSLVYADTDILKADYPVSAVDRAVS